MAPIKKHDADPSLHLGETWLPIHRGMALVGGCWWWFGGGALVVARASGNGGGGWWMVSGAWRVVGFEPDRQVVVWMVGAWVVGWMNGWGGVGGGGG